MIFSNMFGISKWSYSCKFRHLSKDSANVDDGVYAVERTITQSSYIYNQLYSQYRVTCL